MRKKVVSPGGTRLPLIPEDSVDSLLKKCVALDRLEIRRAEYEETSNPVLVLKAFLMAREAGFDPPSWVLDALTVGFKSYLRPRRSPASLDDALGLSAIRGKQNALTELKRKRRNEVLALEVFALRELSNCSIAGACATVAARLRKRMKNGPGNTSVPRLRGEGSYEEMLKKIAEKTPPALRDSAKRLAAAMPPSRRSRFLALYPTDSLPVKRSRKA